MKKDKTKSKSEKEEKRKEKKSANTWNKTHRAINSVPWREVYSHPFLVHYFQFLHNAFSQVTERALTMLHKNTSFQNKGYCIIQIQCELSSAQSVFQYLGDYLLYCFPL